MLTSTHETREDTVFFPALHEILNEEEYEEMREMFEDREHELFGEEGFEKRVRRVAGTEMVLGLYDLNEFTPMKQNSS